MNPPGMEFLQVAEKYGGWVFALVLTAEKLLPFLFQRWFPQFQKVQQAELDQANKELDAKIAAEKDEREHRYQVELRTVEAIDKLATACQGIERFMVSVSDQLVVIRNEMDTRPTQKPIHRKKRRS